MVASDRARTRPLAVEVQAAQGEAAAGNTHPANTLVVVTDPVTGMAVTGLRPEDFTVINHFSLPHQRCGFSNNITSFTDVGTGAYRVQVGLSAEVERCTWVRGEYLMQVIVTSGSRSGQGTAILRIW